MLAPKHLVAIVWDDAHGEALGDMSEADIARDFHKAATYTTFGLLVTQDESGVTIAGDYAEPGLYRSLSFLPRLMIKDIVDFGVPKRPRLRKVRALKESSDAVV